MAIFLNRVKFNFWVPKLITQAREEVILIVPYIKTSEIVFNALKKANKENKRIVIVYRENKLSDNEKEKLSSLENLDLLHHKNIHCKCYFNGDILILGSMNLYEYSQENNREMGVIFSGMENGETKNKYGVEIFDYNDWDIVFDAVKEIREIINSAEIEKKSQITINRGFELNIIKSELELAIKDCKIFNKFFDNKIFVPILDKKAKSNSGEDFYDIGCSNYYDNINLIFEKNRVKLVLNIESAKCEAIFIKWQQDYNEFRFKGFKNYWNSYTQPIYIYKDSKYEFWDKYENNTEESLSAYKKGLVKVFQYYEMLKKKV